jgi:hypothetical protein
VSVAPKPRTKRTVLLDALLELVHSIEQVEGERVTVDRRRLKWLVEVIEGDDAQVCSEAAWREAGAA